MVLELVVGMTLFVVMATGFAANLGVSYKVSSIARARVTAEQLATARIEDARSLSYANVGVIEGNPPGTLPASDSVESGGIVYTRTTDVSYVPDPVPGGYSTFANYKLVRVTVTAPLQSGPLAAMETTVAPGGKPELTDGVIKVTVIDYTANVAVPGATVSLKEGPSAPRNGVTDAAGVATFAQLEEVIVADPYYDIFVSKTGYEVLKENLPPAAVARVALASTQLFQTVIHVYRPAVVSIALVDSLGNPFTGAANVTISSTRGSQTFTTNTGSLTITNVAGEKIVPGLDYTITPTATGFSTPVQQRVLAPGATEAFTFTMQPNPPPP